MGSPGWAERAGGWIGAAGDGWAGTTLTIIFAAADSAAQIRAAQIRAAQIKAVQIKAAQIRAARPGPVPAGYVRLGRDGDQFLTG
jgi:hypothetical protein